MSVHERVITLREHWGHKGEVTVEPYDKPGSLWLNVNIEVAELSSDMVSGCGQQVTFAAPMFVQAMAGIDRDQVDELIAALVWARDLPDEDDA